MSTPPSPWLTASDSHELSIADAYGEHRLAVRRTLGRLGVPAHQLDDAVHDVYVVLLRRVADFDRRRSSRSWLLGIARRVALSYRRRNTVRRGLPLWEEHRDPGPEEHAARSEAHDMLREFLTQLDEHKSMVYVLAEIQGMRAPEIARTLGVNLNTVYWRLRVAREELDRLVASRRPPEHSGWVIAMAPLRRAFGSIVARLLPTLDAGFVSLVALSMLMAVGGSLESAFGVRTANARPAAPAREHVPWQRVVMPSMEVQGELPVSEIVEPPLRIRGRRAPRDQFTGTLAMAMRVRKPKPRVGRVASKISIRTTIRAHINEVRACYNRTLLRDASARGRVVLTFLIAPDGTVARPEIEQSDLTDEALDRCIVDAARSWRFTAPHDGRWVGVRYPFAFDAQPPEKSG